MQNQPKLPKLDGGYSRDICANQHTHADTDTASVVCTNNDAYTANCSSNTCTNNGANITNGSSNTCASDVFTYCIANRNTDSFPNYMYGFECRGRAS